MDRRISWLRILACFMVVLLHASGSTAAPGDGWWAAHAWNSATRACVPLFFMVSGATLLLRDEALAPFLRKRLARIVPPLLLWSCVYLGWIAWHGGATGNWLVRIGSGPVMYHLWYFYAILGIYAFVPVLRHFVLRASAAELGWYLGIWFLAASVGPFALSLLEPGCGWLAPGPLLTLWHLGPYLGYAGYLVLGAIAWRHAGRLGGWRTGLVLCAAGTAVTLLGGAWQASSLGTPCALFYLYLSPNVVIQALGIFMVIAGLRAGAPSPAVSLVAAATTGVYGLHVLGLDRVGAWFGLSAAAGNPWLATPATAAVAFGLSLAVIMLLRLVPPLRVAV